MSNHELSGDIRMDSDAHLDNQVLIVVEQLKLFPLLICYFLIYFQIKPVFHIIGQLSC